MMDTATLIIASEAGYDFIGDPLMPIAHDTETGDCLYIRYDFAVSADHFSLTTDGKDTLMTVSVQRKHLTMPEQYVTAMIVETLDGLAKIARAMIEA